jgi:hypothetical protein
LVVVAAGDGQEDFGPEDLDGRGDARAADLGQVVLLLDGGLSERCLFVAGPAASAAREALIIDRRTTSWPPAGHLIHEKRTPASIAIGHRSVRSSLVMSRPWWR